MPASLKLLKESLKKGKKSGVKHVFAKWASDSLYYRCHLIELNEPKKKCLVRYEDDLEAWTDLADIHTQLSLKHLQQEHIICTVCEGGISEAPNQIVICEVCEQGYHQKCHSPAIPDSSIDKPDVSEISIDWTCQTCSYIASTGHVAPQEATGTPNKKKTQPPSSVVKKRISVSIKVPAAKQENSRAKRALRETRSKPGSAVTKGKNLDKTRKKLVLGAEDGLKQVIPNPVDFEGENNPLL